MSATIIGTSVLAQLLRVERAFGAGGTETPAFGTLIRWLLTGILATFIAVYYVLHFVSIDIAFPLALSTFCDLVTCVALYSTIWTAPLTISLGLDVPQARSASTILTSTNILKDQTLHRIGLGCIVAFVVAATGDLIFFLTLGWGRNQIIHDSSPPPPLWLAFLYVLGCLTTNAGLTLGSGYVATAHNVLACQIQGLGHHLEHETNLVVSARYDDVNKTMYGSMDDDQDSIMLSLTAQDKMGGDSGGMHHLSPQEVISMHREFRRRMEALAVSFHRRVALAMLAFGVEIILVVTVAYEEHGHEWGRLQLVGLIGIFFANSFSLWFMAFTFGRVNFVSREECACAAAHWATLTKEGDRFAMDAATILYRFPVRFHVGPFELTEEVSKAITFLLLGLAGLFIGVRVPEF